MQPKDLKAVFTWEGRHVLIRDRVWYYPDYYEDTKFVFPGWDHPDLFGNNNPVNIEYCSGNGAWIIDKAKADRNTNWVAVEMKYERVRKIWSKAKNEKLDNLIVVCGEGYRWTKQYIVDSSISKVFVNFPDPWPKERHAKNRIIQKPFALEMMRILKENGSITLVTDDEKYSNQMIEVFRHTPESQSFYPDPYFSPECTGYGTSYFEHLWRDLGRLIRYHQFDKRQTA